MVRSLQLMVDIQLERYEEDRIMQEFIKFIESIMEVKPGSLTEDTAYGQHEKWDSLMHMRLVMEIEEEYDVEIPIDEVPNIKTLKDFYQYIEKQ